MHIVIKYAFGHDVTICGDGRQAHLHGCCNLKLKKWKNPRFSFAHYLPCGKKYLTFFSRFYLCFNFVSRHQHQPPHLFDVMLRWKNVFFSSFYHEQTLQKFRKKVNFFFLFTLNKFRKYSRTKIQRNFNWKCVWTKWQNWLIFANQFFSFYFVINCLGSIPLIFLRLWKFSFLFSIQRTCQRWWKLLLQWKKCGLQSCSFFRIKNPFFKLITNV